MVVHYFPIYLFPSPFLWSIIKPYKLVKFYMLSVLMFYTYRYINRTKVHKQTWALTGLTILSKKITRYVKQVLFLVCEAD